MKKAIAKSAKSFRLLPETAEKIRRVALKVGKNETAAVELMISAYEE